jgi:hypothetical protein
MYFLTYKNGRKKEKEVTMIPIMYNRIFSCLIIIILSFCAISLESMAKEQSIAPGTINYHPDLLISVAERLTEEGFYDKRIKPVYGLAMQSALRRFQEEQGLNVSGEIDQETLTALEIEIATEKLFMTHEEVAASAKPKEAAPRLPFDLYIKAPPKKGVVWQQEINFEEAASVRLYFQKLELRRGQALEINNEKNKTVARFTRSAVSPFWTDYLAPLPLTITLRDSYGGAGGQVHVTRAQIKLQKTEPAMQPKEIRDQEESRMRRILADCDVCAQPFASSGKPFDIDNDGKDDAYVRSPNWAGVIRSTSTGFTQSWIKGGWVGNWNLGTDNWDITGDVDGDGHGDVIIRSPEWLGIFKGNGIGLSFDWIKHDWVGNWNLGFDDHAEAGDFNGDGMTDLVLRSDEWIGLLISDGSELTNVWLKHDWLGNWNLGMPDRERVGDYTGDGKADIMVRSPEWIGRFISTGSSLTQDFIKHDWLGNWNMGEVDRLSGGR